MAASFARLQTLVRDFKQNSPASPSFARKPVVILLHGLGGDQRDWTNPFQDRNWPYDHQRGPEEIDLGVHPKPPGIGLPGVETKYFLSPRMASNNRGQDGSDDRSWWHGLTAAGFPVFTYSQVPDLMVPLTKGPVAQFKKFMETLQQDVLADPSYRSRQVVLLGHSRGGLIGRAYLGDPEVKADQKGRFPNVKGLITLSSPHQGSHMALMDDKVIAFLNKLEKVVPDLPNDIGSSVIKALKAKVDAYVGAHGDEIEPGSPLFRALEAQEPVRPGVRFVTVGGISPRLFRLYLWAYHPSSLLPKKGTGSKLEFHWRAHPLEAKGASPFPDGIPLKVLGVDVDEIIPGRGDGLTADKRCRLPTTFKTEEHLSVRLSHAEELWSPDLQREIATRLNTFQ